ncbi:MAG: class I SAM-dependent methyltransferase [Gemmatimonadales bacterium]|nr:class I SAM-dependent methyltransferase [Gemmatimonadales bacterium]
MSFAPLPKVFLEYLEDCNQPSARILDLGCGDGDFFTPLLPLKAQLISLDRVKPQVGTSPILVADAKHPPFRPRSMDLIVAANLFRHILFGEMKADFLENWCGLLRPGGALFLFEDEPTVFPPAARNYGQVQDFLLRLLPGERGPLLARADFEGLIGRGTVGSEWVLGLGRNDLKPDLEAIQSLLSSNGVAPGSEVSQLLRALDQDGLAYGDFWWACWRADSA